MLLSKLKSMLGMQPEPVGMGDVKEFDKSQGLGQRPDLSEFLNKIKFLESSGGLNTQHRTMAGGIHDGESAYGSYGLMPNTIQELLNRKRLSGELVGPLKDLYNQNDETVKNALKNDPQTEQELAQQLAEKLNTTHQGDADKMAYGWFMGHNKPTGAIAQEDLDKNFYVNRFKNLKNKLP